jgi:flagellar basal-body rod modification protein FlgD
MTSIISHLTTPTPSTGSATQNSANASGDPLADQNVFLQLLVAQLQNQDPESPADGTTFITQLAQFSQLSNSAQMLGDLDAIQRSVATLAAATPPAGSSSHTSGVTPPSS